MSNGKTMASFVVSKRLLDEVRQLAVANDRSVSAELRRAVVAHVRAVDETRDEQ
jgi:hypothetical protein